MWRYTMAWFIWDSTFANALSTYYVGKNEREKKLIQSKHFIHSRWERKTNYKATKSCLLKTHCWKDIHNHTAVHTYTTQIKQTERIVLKRYHVCMGQKKIRTEKNGKQKNAYTCARSVIREKKQKLDGKMWLKNCFHCLCCLFVLCTCFT